MNRRKPSRNTIPVWQTMFSIETPLQQRESSQENILVCCENLESYNMAWSLVNTITQAKFPRYMSRVDYFVVESPYLSRIPDFHMFQRYVGVVLVGEQLGRLVFPEMWQVVGVSLSVVHGSVFRHPHCPRTMFTITYDPQRGPKLAQFFVRTIQRFLGFMSQDAKWSSGGLPFEEYHSIRAFCDALSRAVQNALRAPQETWLDFCDAPRRVLVFLDTETDTVDIPLANVTLVQVLVEQEERALVYQVSDQDPRWAQEFFQSLWELRDQVRLVCHNTLFDFVVLTRHSGLNWFQFRFLDTLLFARGVGITDCALKHLSAVLELPIHPMDFFDYWHRNSLYTTLSYAVGDVFALRELVKAFRRRYPWRIIDWLSESSQRIFSKTVLTGISVDHHRLREYLTQVTKRETEALDELRREGPIGLNWKSQREVLKYFLSRGLNLESIAERDLSVYQDRDTVVQKFLEYTEARKIRELLHGFDTSIIYPRMNILGAETGRTSCVSPNIQQLPKQYRDIITSQFPDGYLGVLDLSSAEVIACIILTGDPQFAAKLGEADFHKSMAATCFNVPIDQVTPELRSTAKAITFGALLYGGTPKGIAQRTNASEELIAQAVSTLQKQFSKMTAWFQGQIATAERYRIIIDAFGKYRDLRWIPDRGTLRRIARNTPIQALSAYICLLLCVFIDEYLRNCHARSTVIFQVHDEIIVDVYPGERREVTEAFSQAFARLDTVEELRRLPGWSLVHPKGTLKFLKTWGGPEIAQEVS